MEGTSHERIVVWRIAENNELGAAQRTSVFGCLGCILYDFAHQADSIHVDTGLGRTHID